ncbi:serine hydrolase domain-containing protein [Neolewinella litorea]|uniref:serine hydrolase domain-containing protein n=1 Tax=Neolewinella litorea TaxID=2562452 RepID=UPI0014561053|nr:serine hydrolase [Neolewinella litorea]
MHTSPLKRWLVGLTLFIVLLFSAYLWVKPLLSIGGGYAAKHACSCHFLQGRALEEISEHDLNFSVLGRYSLERFGDTVRASLPGLMERRAVHLPGRGCVLINDPKLSLPPADGKPATAREPQAFRLAPNDTGQVTTFTPDLSAALDFGMQAVPGGGARGLVILKDGQLAGERYAPGCDHNSRLLGWSMTKTLTGLAVGAYLYRNSATHTAPADAAKQNTGLFPTYWTDARSDIALADLLRMNSGLAWNEGYGSITDATVMLHERPDFADFALRSQLTATPGREWNYSSGTTNILMEYLRGEIGDNAGLYAFVDSLFRPVAPSLLIEPDQSGRPVGSSYGWATTRDWARLGQLMLQEGIWQGDTLVPAEWIEFMREPAAGSEGIYGAQLWLPGPDTPSIPADAFMMRGFQDQRVFILPSHGLVIARLGHSDDKVTDFDGLIQRILVAYE